MKRPSEQLFKDLSSMQNYGPFLGFIEWIEESLEEERQKMARAEQPQLGWLQGGVQKLEEILNTFREADTTLTRFEKKKNPGL